MCDRVGLCDYSGFIVNHGELVEGKSCSEIVEIAGVFRRMMVQGRVPDSVDEDVLGDAVVLRDVSRFPVRVKCALLAWATLEDAIGSFGVVGYPPRVWSLSQRRVSQKESARWVLGATLLRWDHQSQCETLAAARKILASRRILVECRAIVGA